jgi:hypothetical protein
MDPLIFYWVITLIVLIVLIIITDVGTATFATMILIVIKFMVQPYQKHTRPHRCSGFEEGNDSADSNETSGNTGSLPKQASVKLAKPKQASVKPAKPKPNKSLPQDVLDENEKMLDGILNPKSSSMDDKIFDASITSGLKAKKSKDIRAHWNNSNWKKYYDYELGIHEQENRDWWADDDFELSKKHVVI